MIAIRVRHCTYKCTLYFLFVGTSLFLKNRFGAGYMLSIAKTDHPVSQANRQAQRRLSKSTSPAIEPVELQLEESKSSADEEVKQSQVVVTKGGLHGHSGATSVAVAAITSGVQGVVPTAVLVTEYAGELVYRLPIDMASKLG